MSAPNYNNWASLFNVFILMCCPLYSLPLLSKFNYQFTFQSNNNHLKNHVCCLHKPLLVYCPSRMKERKKKKGSNKEQSSAMSEVNHWRKHFNIFLFSRGNFFSSLFIILQRAGVQMMILWTDIEGKRWKGICFYCPSPRHHHRLNTHKKKTSAFCYHFEGKREVNLGRIHLSEVEIYVSGRWIFLISTWQKCFNKGQFVDDVKTGINFCRN